MVKPKSVCGISVVKRKITANLAVIFLKLVDPRRIELPNLSDANRTLSRTRHSTGPTLLAKQGFLPALLGPVYCAGFLGDANHWEEASE